MTTRPQKVRPGLPQLMPSPSAGHALPSRRGRDRAEASNYPSGATETFVYAAFPPLADPLGAPADLREFPEPNSGYFSLPPCQRLFPKPRRGARWPAVNRHHASRGSMQHPAIAIKLSALG